MTVLTKDMLPLRLVANTSAFTAALTEFSEALAKLPELPAEVVDALLGLVDGRLQLVTLGVDGGAAAGTGELCVLVQPSHGFEILLAAARAGNLDLSIIEQALRHSGSPSGVDAPMVTESPAGQQPAGEEV